MLAKAGGGVHVPAHERFVLDNGITLVIVPRNDATGFYLHSAQFQFLGRYCVIMHRIEVYPIKCVICKLCQFFGGRTDVNRHQSRPYGIREPLKNFFPVSGIPLGVPHIYKMQLRRFAQLENSRGKVSIGHADLTNRAAFRQPLQQLIP